MSTKDCCKVETKKSLLPLYILLSCILLLSIWLTYIFPANTFMMYLMGVWFLSFGVLKLVDLPSFARSFAQYDLIAMRWHNYGYIYPFIEIVLGLIYIFNTQMHYMLGLNIVALVVAILWVISAYRVLSSGKDIVCACMGTYWQLPMTRVTIMENGAMFLMIAYMLLYPSSMMNTPMSDTMMMDMADWTESHVMQVDESTIMSSEMMTPPTSSDNTAMREHCQMMPEMAGCEKFR